MSNSQQKSAQQKTKIKTKRTPTKLIVPEAIGLSDDHFKKLIAGWVVPRMIAEFISNGEWRDRLCRRAASWRMKNKKTDKPRT